MPRWREVTAVLARRDRDGLSLAVIPAVTGIPVGFVGVSVAADAVIETVDRTELIAETVPDHESS